MTTHLSPRIHLGTLLRQMGDASASGEVTELRYEQGGGAQTMRFTEPAPFRISVNSLQGNEFWLQGKFEPTLSLECARCLRPVAVPLSLKLGTLMRYEPSAQAPYLEEADTGEEILVFGDPDLDLSNYLAESTLLEAPLTVLHDEACKGLCQVCGHDLNDGPCEHSAAVPIEDDSERFLEAQHEGKQHARQNPFLALQSLELPDE
ncbi:hypothetical protein DKM44_12105 [Deinococcus irradiatisoli]|uniref:DUF177 domain-containing protein n=1 Tax=Deinococcus irradiatisoli TaxID=2202254 RepID=A0A2Z3JI24_9DEIO|nr:YceD family protein [Deinococcus irradiatisoli]AWN24662.1 hypothetical protein DKM44_12105 [Deinococcus irradiatisoli]